MDRRLLGYFAALFLPAAALLTAAATYVYRSQVASQVDEIRLRESIDTQRGVQTLRQNLEYFSRDILFMKALPSLRQALDRPGPEALRTLEETFVAAARANRNLDQVRWIDEMGMERARVDSVGAQAHVIPADAPQNTRDRHYFDAINRIGAGDVYISPLDLNVERGAVELPHKPMLRIGTPLFDTLGRRRGMLVVNYRAEPMLAEFDDAMRDLHGTAMLLNAAGHFLRSDDRSEDWGFMFGREPPFVARHDAAWQQLRRMPRSQFLDNDGLWTVETVQPQDVVDRAAGAVRAGASRPLPPARQGPADWLVVSYVDAGKLAAITRPVRNTLAGGTLLLLAFGLLASALQARHWRRRETQTLSDLERDARESESGLRLVLQSNPNAMLIVDAGGRIMEANPRACDAFLQDESALRGLTVDDLLPQALRSAHREKRRGYFDAPHARPMGAGLELCARRGDGSVFPVEISLAPLSVRGEPCVVATVIDITARKDAEKMVRELNSSLEKRVDERTRDLRGAEANLRLLLESSASGLYGVDTDGRITFANPAAGRILGVEPASLVGRRAADLVLPDPATATTAADSLARTLRDGRAFTVDDASFRHASGAAVPVMFSSHPMVRDDAIVGAVVSFIDMTERRRLDEAREAALHEAERLAQARSDFLANMSHEIRTPLNGVLGLAQVGHREQQSGEAARESFGRILDAGRTLLGVVDNVLDFSRIEAGKVHVEAVAVDLPDLLDEVLSSVAPVAEAKGVGLRIVRADTTPARCVTDPMRLKQILLNLLANAVKFTERGEVVLDVRANEGRLRLAVRDTGIGINDEQASRIFSAFEQADSSTTRRFGGTGLGLAICKRIVDLMQGTIEVRSQPGAGSEFVVTLPLVEPAPDVPAPKRVDLDSSGTRRVARLAGLRILLAEDNEVNQMVAQAMLRREGPEVVTVGDGQLAVDAVVREGADAFDVVLMDIQMPGMDGFEATRRIHAIAPSLPVIGQTAHVLQDTIEQCRAAGMVAHLPKPIDRHELIMLIMQHARRTDVSP